MRRGPSALVNALVIALVAATGCAPRTTVIGPFVKAITRTNDTLLIESCEIVLQGNQLLEGMCSVQRLRLNTGAMPQVAPPPAAPTSPSAAPTVPPPKPPTVAPAPKSPTVAPAPPSAAPPRR